jgi:hypothetical protein
VPEVSEAIFTAGATGAALQQMLIGSQIVRAQHAGSDGQNAGRALSIPVSHHNSRQ